ncbi:hypothetical protein B0H14DRAFT_3485021 [Mycena olivaceomarginata]|nr:hypothetical protein B0H14DRAFT_3485021 [Mycena olivaceomarginata]
MANDRYIFARLRSINYANDWNVRMEAVLIQKQLWGMIQILVDQTKSDGTAKTETEMETERRALIATRDPVKMAKACAELVCIEPSQLAHMTSRDPMIIWDDLDRIALSACAGKKYDSDGYDGVWLSVSYDSVLNLGQSLGLRCTMENTLFVATEPHGLGYENLNISTSIFVEQRGASSPAKVTSGTFGVLYGLQNANFDDMLIAPIMRRLSASTGLHFNRDIRPSSEHLRIFHDQLIITVIETLLIYNEGFDDASTIEEATVRGNFQYHNELYVTQLKRTPEEMSKYAIPSFSDQLTNARICGAQLLRSKDVNAWESSINELSSLAYFFALMEKKRLSNDQPDYHSLLAALTQILHGLLLNAWSRECGFSSFKLFADSKPNPAMLRNIASRIVNNYAIPMAEFDFSESPKDPAADDQSLDSETNGEEESPSPSHLSPAPADNPNNNVTGI